MTLNSENPLQCTEFAWGNVGYLFSYILHNYLFTITMWIKNWVIHSILRWHKIRGKYICCISKTIEYHHSDKTGCIYKKGAEISGCYKYVSLTQSRRKAHMCLDLLNSPHGTYCELILSQSFWLQKFSSEYLPVYWIPGSEGRFVWSSIFLIWVF